MNFIEDDKCMSIGFQTATNKENANINLPSRRNSPKVVLGCLNTTVDSAKDTMSFKIGKKVSDCFIFEHGNDLLNSSQPFKEEHLDSLDKTASRLSEQSLGESRSNLFKRGMQLQFFKPSLESNSDSNSLPSSNSYLESPIRAVLARQLIAQYLSSSNQQESKILVFKRKKIINSSDKRYMELLLSQDYSYEVKRKRKPKTKTVTVKEEHETKLAKTIKKSGLVQKLSTFWNFKQGIYPTAFKKIAIDKIRKKIFEIHDFSGHSVGIGMGLENLNLEQ